MLLELLRGLIADSAGDQPSFLVQFVPLIAVTGIVYFLLLRPQQKQQKDQLTMVASLKKGDEVVTSGGIFGKIHQVNDKDVLLEIAKDVRIRVLKSFVQARTTTAPAGEPGAVKSDGNDKSDKKEGK